MVWQSPDWFWRRVLAAEPFLWTPTVFTRIAAAAFVLGLPWLAMQWAAMRESQESELMDNVRRMCGADLQRVAMEGAAAWQGQPSTNPAMAQIEANFIELARTMDELEQLRQGADIRARRITSERDQLLEVFRGLDHRSSPSIPMARSC